MVSVEREKHRFRRQCHWLPDLADQRRPVPLLLSLAQDSLVSSNR